MLILELHIKDMTEEYDYNCFMLETPFKNWDNLLEKIDDKDVYDNEKGEYGKEDEPHITILYGLHNEVSFDDIKKITDKAEKPINFEVKGIDYFESEEFDVLKLNVESESLRTLNEKACGHPYTNEYDTYNPHMTVAYLKKGKGKKYTQYFEPSLAMSSETFSYSTTEGKKYYWD